jgi:hypothetical protein
MRNNKSKILISSIIILVFILAGSLFFQTNDVKANDEICDTFSEISQECLGIPTNCFCPIDIPGDPIAPESEEG